MPPVDGALFPGANGTGPAGQEHARAAHELLDAAATTSAARAGRMPRLPGLRQVVRDSWARSLRHVARPQAAAASLALDSDALRDYRQAHPLSLIMPVVRRLLVEPCRDLGVLVAVGDEHGRLLWVEGDRGVRLRAESMMFTAGADWSEQRVGTSAPGTSLILRRGVQIAGAEHFCPAVHEWSCTAVPVHDPDTNEVLGVVDLTGGPEAVGPHALALVKASVAAAEAELQVCRLTGRAPRLTPSAPVELRVLGRHTGLLVRGTTSVELSLRHSEILTLLALNPRGLDMARLGHLVKPDFTATTLRAEMVRLRRVLDGLGADLVPQSRPYRLGAHLPLDAARVLHDLARGSHRMALEHYRGSVLPDSRAPGIVRYRQEVDAALREAILTDGSLDTLLRFLALPESGDDAEAWFAALRRLPARSPKRAAIVHHLELLESERR